MPEMPLKRPQMPLFLPKRVKSGNFTPCLRRTQVGHRGRHRGIYAHKKPVLTALPTRKAVKGFYTLFNRLTAQGRARRLQGHISFEFGRRKPMLETLIHIVFLIMGIVIGATIMYGFELFMDWKEDKLNERDL